MKHFLKYLIVFPLGFLGACDSSDNPAVPDIGKAYYPLQKGFFQLYDVSEIIYQLGVPDTFYYQLKTQVVDSFPKQGGGYTYVQYRSKRDQGEQEWSYLDTWSARVDSREIVVNEENVPYLKIKLPVSPGTFWNGNQYNAKDDDEYVISEANQPYTVNNENFSECVIITQSDNEDYIVFLDQRKEIYGKHVGLIAKETTQLSYCTSTAQGCLTQQIIESGVIFKQSIIGYGIE